MNVIVVLYYSKKANKTNNCNECMKVKLILNNKNDKES